jgi:hypothetical protein
MQRGYYENFHKGAILNFGFKFTRYNFIVASAGLFCR